MKLNYKSGLTLFYNLLRSEHEGRGDSDNARHKMISGRVLPGNDQAPDYHRFGNRGNQFNSLMGILRICGHAKRVNALAWVKREMLIKSKVLVEDSPIYRKVMKEFRISEKEVNQAMVRIS